MWVSLSRVSILTTNLHGRQASDRTQKGQQIDVSIGIKELPGSPPEKLFFVPTSRVLAAAPLGQLLPHPLRSGVLQRLQERQSPLGRIDGHPSLPQRIQRHAHVPQRAPLV
jgi:hypothetical protein